MRMRRVATRALQMTRSWMVMMCTKCRRASVSNPYPQVVSGEHMAVKPLSSGCRLPKPCRRISSRSGGAAASR
eukprot:6956025-Prymnesium_polylepis.1